MQLRRTGSTSSPGGVRAEENNQAAKQSDLDRRVTNDAVAGEQMTEKNGAERKDKEEAGEWGGGHSEKNRKKGTWMMPEAVVGAIDGGFWPRGCMTAGGGEKKKWTNAEKKRRR